jgi:DNA-binding MarR family transcriptional regulator
MVELNVSASPLFLRDEEIRRGIERLFSGYSNLVRSADQKLEAAGIGRAHQRALYFIARHPGLTVTDLLGLLAITKQSLSRVLAELQARGLVLSEPGKVDRRQRLLSLSATGTALERELFETLRAGMADAYARAGQDAVTGFWAVLNGLIPAADQRQLARLSERDRDGKNVTATKPVGHRR